MPAPTGRIAVVVKGYPRLTNAFVTQELAALEAAGLELLVFAQRTPAAADRAAEAPLAAPVVYLPHRLARPGCWLAARRRLRRRPGYRAARRLWLADLRRDPRPARLAHFAMACLLAAELPGDVARLYAHFLEGPGAVADYAAAIAGIPWCGFAHADLWALPQWEARERLARAEWLATCTAAGRRRLTELGAEPGRLELAYHGLPPELLAAAPPVRPPRDGTDPGDPAVILSVGRAVPKKGYDVLLRALARLPAGLAWRFEHVGAGPQAGKLAALARAAGLGDRVDWLGPRPRPEVLQRCRAADLFVLAGRVAADGRRDGLPNVLLEAQSQGLACVAAEVSAIPELIRPGETGLLVPPEDPAALARAIEGLIGDPQRRARMGAAAAARVRSDFDMREGVDRLRRRLAAPPATALTRGRGGNAPRSAARWRPRSPLPGRRRRSGRSPAGRSAR